MTTYAKTLGGTSGHPSPTGKKLTYMVERIVDFSVDANAAGDVFQVLNIPANSVVEKAGIEVLVADTAGHTGTLSLADSAGTTTYVAAAAPTATGQMTSVQGKDTVYGTAVTLNLDVGTGAINAKARAWALVTDVSSYANEATV